MKFQLSRKSQKDKFPASRSCAFGVVIIFLFGLMASYQTRWQTSAAESARGRQQNGQRRRQAPSRNKPQTTRRTSSEPVVQVEVPPSKGLEKSELMTRVESDEVNQTGRPSNRIRRQPPGGGPRGGGSGNSGQKTSEFSAPPATTFDPVNKTMINLGSDPQLAVGEHFIVATEAHHVAFFNKQGNPLKTKPNVFGGAVPIRMKAATLFGPVLEQFLRNEGGDIDTSRPNPADINRHLGHQTGPSSLICNPDDPKAAGCITEAYDTRVVYDRERHRFWIVSGLRDEIWGSSSSECNKGKTCAAQDTGLPRRFVGVAVTRTEDPRDGFFEFVLVDEYADWPRFAVHGPFLIISHNDNTNVYLFDAQKLADGNLKHELVGLGSFYKGDFNVQRIFPVVQHDRRDETDQRQDPFIPIVPAPPGTGSKNVPTFLVGLNGNKVTIFYFDPVLIDPVLSAIFHPKLASATIDIHDDAPHLTSNPVYRNGFIYLVGDHCVDGDSTSCNHEIRFLRIPVFRGPDFLGSVIYASPVPSLGFKDITFGGGSEDNSLAGPSFEIPAVDVNKNDDVVIVYGRAGFWLNLFQDAPGAFYHLIKNNRESDGILHQAMCGPKPEDKLKCAQPQPDQSGIDVSAVVVDPSDDTTLWMAHGFADGSMPQSKKYRMVIGKVKP